MNLLDGELRLKIDRIGEDSRGVSCISSIWHTGWRRDLTDVGTMGMGSPAHGEGHQETVIFLLIGENQGGLENYLLPS